MSPFRGPWGWMYWNLTLAAVPMLLALVLFRRRVRTGVLWWVGVALFVAFLPNAPYVLTDIIHLRWDIARGTTSTTELSLRYGTLLLFGMAAFAIAMWRCSRFLVARDVRTRWVALINLATCAICSLGIYLGRVHRLNSWDIVRAPHAVLRATLNGLSSHLALAGMALVFTASAFAALVGTLALESIASLHRRQSQ